MKGSEGLVSVMVLNAAGGPYVYLTEDLSSLCRGDVVEVPLGTRKSLGVVWKIDVQSSLPRHKLKWIARRVGVTGLPLDLLDFIEWVSGYTLSLPGLVLRSILCVPPALEAPSPEVRVVYCGVTLSRITAARGRVLSAGSDGVARSRGDLARQAKVGLSVVKGLVDLGVFKEVIVPLSASFESPDIHHAPPVLTEDQEAAVATLGDLCRKDDFSVTLLDGVTGSGKTEVYFEAVAAILETGCQALIMLPEIALTDQFIERFKDRFGVFPAEWHSGLTVRKRIDVWRSVRCGQARVVIGARSSLFLPFRNLGLIVVDEEHEGAYKQEDVFCYHARDMAVKRAQISRFPVILSSATPSIETRVNVRSGRYGVVHLRSRFGSGGLPDVSAVDLRLSVPAKGLFLSPVLLEMMRSSLDQKRQVLLFLNRRGYAPLTLCGACGGRLTCSQCSAWLVEHRFRGSLICHYCGFRMPIPSSCPFCNAEDRLVACGPGVERICEEVALHFPDARRTVLSSDFSEDLSAMRLHFRAITKGDYDIIIGTQLLAKGHHFPSLGLVGVVDGDLGLSQADLRASEHNFQLLHQVFGRAGRGDFRGYGLIQTHMPEHPVMRALVTGDSEAFYEAEIGMREREGLPPFGRLAALIVSAPDQSAALHVAQRLVHLAPLSPEISVLGPAEAPLSLLRGRYRFRILIKGTRSVDFSSYLRSLLSALGRCTRDVRVRVDVDPQSFL
ncbi:MAG: primosomal protein N' [Alphaproteobacteria bacterium]|nr:primosomal protein N' [Alphaproteobacteria bacterium]